MLALLNRYAAVGLVTLLAAPTAAQQHSSDIVADRILTAVTCSSSLEENLRVLCDEIGPRMPGTPGMKQAVAWSEAAFRKAGADTVRTESFEIPASWQEGDTRIEVTSPVRFEVRGVSSAWVPATRRGGLRAEVIDGGTGVEGFIRRLGRRAKGKILLVRSETVRTFLDLAHEQRDTTIALREADEVGAAAVLFMSTRPHRLLYRHVNVVDGRLDVLPTALLAREDAERIRRILESGRRVHMHLRLPNKTGGPFKAHNVVAEVRGREESDEFLLVGAHLDSWDMGTGCLDNAANVSLVIEAARAISTGSHRPRRTIRFALFGGEELGLFGSLAYIRQHADELDDHVAVIVHDMGIGPVLGYSVGGRHDVLKNLRAALMPVRDRWDLEHPTQAFFGSDHFDFLLQGVPALVAIQDTSDYYSPYHSEADTFDKIDMSQVRDRTALAAATVLGIANLPQRFGKRNDRNRVDNLLIDSGLEDQMKFLGIWDAWLNGNRSYRESPGR